MTARRLLIIDDEADFGALVRRVAEKLAFVVEATTHARDFKDVYKRFDPTVVILDMIMPEVDGIELVAWLASVQCKARIIIISGFTPLYAKTAMQLGEARGLSPIVRLAKPVSLAVLTATLLSAAQEAGEPI
jgi:DNA-binding NtrC family response regulator